jgi:hypothetical protein
MRYALPVRAKVVILFLDQMKKWAAWFVKTDQYTLSLSTPQVAPIRSVAKRETRL